MRAGRTWRLAIDREGRRIRFRGQALDLTRYEYALLEALLQRPGAILSRAQLMDRGWDSSADSADRTVDTHVKTLRAKLRAVGAGRRPDPHASRARVFGGTVKVLAPFVLSVGAKRRSRRAPCDFAPAALRSG